ncbi:MAG: TetR/AcrR family transcriptional regulator [Actinobacteria bacterium]|nr:TetR/AcrR family transcriptional regulator [Actinomycetota bacterium]
MSTRTSTSTPTPAPAPARQAPRRLLPRQERHASILQAAATAFAGEGFAATSMEDVAAAAGVTKLIVYRHFESKEDLYRAVLMAVATRLHDEFVANRSAPDEQRRGYTLRSILTVARENPDGYRLLMVHAAREPQFAEMHRRVQEVGFEIAGGIIGDRISDPVIKAWASRTSVEYLNTSVLEWLEVGDPERDDEFADLATEGLIAMFLAWVD